MADEKEWQPRTREDWVSMMSDAVKGGIGGLISEREEAAAKGNGDDNGDGDKTGKEKQGDGNRGKSAVDRLLGI